MPKDHPIDVTVREYRDLQDKSADSPVNRRTWLALLVTAALLSAAFGIGIYLLPQNTVSAEENRTLQTFPAFSGEAFLSGEYSADIATFYADQFPLRNGFVGMKALSEALLLKQENNGVLIGKNGYLIDRLEYGEREYANLEINLKAVKSFSALSEAAGKPCVFAAAPRTVDTAVSVYPALYTNTRASVITNRITAEFPRAGEIIDLLKEKSDNGEYVMYKTDHHWTSLGAYYAYASLGTSLGYEPLPRSYFTEETVSTDFLGTTYSSSGVKWQEGDTVTLFRTANDGDYTVTVHDNGDMQVGFYDEGYLEEKDKYRVFLGGNFGRVSVKRNGDTDRPTLLVVKDSFALSMVPFLSRHFDLELIDLRYFSGSVADLLTHEQSEAESNTLPEPDKVLILLGVDSLAESDILRKLLYGVQ